MVARGKKHGPEKITNLYVRWGMAVTWGKGSMSKLFRRTKAKPIDDPMTASPGQTDDSKAPSLKTPALIQEQETSTRGGFRRRAPPEMISHA